MRAQIGLELAAIPATEQSLENTGAFESKGFTKLKFPVHLGEAQKDADGLVGYFTDSPQADRSGPFYCAAGAMGPGYPGAIEYGHTPGIDLETPMDVTLLMDPRAKVHAVTGIVPKRAAMLPLRASSASKAVKEAFFQVAPIASPGGAISMPKPSDDYGKWSWAYRPQVTMWKEADGITATADQAGFSPEPVKLSEGWLKLRLNTLSILNFWVKEGTLLVQPNTNITLGWTLSGGSKLTSLHPGGSASGGGRGMDFVTTARGAPDSGADVDDLHPHLGRQRREQERKAACGGAPGSKWQWIIRLSASSVALRHRQCWWVPVRKAQTAFM